MQSLQSQLTVATMAFQAGDIARSEMNALEILKVHPRSAEAMLLLGVIKGIQNLHEEAESILKRALVYDTKNPAIYFNLAKSLIEQKKHDEAIGFHKKAIALAPREATIWLNYGLSLFESEKFKLAIDAFDASIRCDPKIAKAYSNKAACLSHSRLFSSAIELCDTALKLDPLLAEAWNHKGLALEGLKKYEEAIQNYDQAILLKPEYAKAWSNKGRALTNLKKLQDAISCHQKAVNLDPSFARSWSNLANTLNEMGDYERAIDACDKAISLDPAFAEAWNNKALAFSHQKKYKSASDCIKEAINIKPEEIIFWTNYGNILSNLKQNDEALEAFEKALNIDPSDKEAMHNKGLLHLKLKQFQAGFNLHEHRWSITTMLEKNPKTSIPKFSLSNNSKKTLLWAEQGLGDEVFYYSFVKHLSKMTNLTVAADARLHNILKRSFNNIALVDRRLIGSELTKTEYDAQLPIGDIGAVLGLNEQKIKDTREAYLRPSNSLDSSLDRRLSELKSNPIIGLSWQSKAPKIGASKSIGLQEFKPLFELENCDFLSLQYGDVHDEIAAINRKYNNKIHNFDDVDLFNNIDTLLTLISRCDLVVTTSNVTAHLCGAIGKPTAVLVPFAKGKMWYWHEETYSLWYPTLRLFHQSSEETWISEINEVRRWVKETLK